MRIDVQLARGFPRAVDMGTSGPAFKTADDRLGWRETTSVVPWSRPCWGLTGVLDRSLTGQLYMIEEVTGVK